MNQPRQLIVRERRQYNKWAASQTLEDYALRYTADKARKWSSFRIANTAFGAISFLACEAIGGALTLAYGFSNAVTSILVVCALMFFIGLPIARYAAKYGLDIDLLTRGAGFGYMGSTITSLIYASFTFLLLAIEASIMSGALEMVLGIPLWLGHILSSVVLIPIAIYGISLINRMQIATQPVWLILQFLPFGLMLFIGDAEGLEAWRKFSGTRADGSLALLPFSLCASTLLSLLPQIGEQADYLRFLPNPQRAGRKRWWAAMLWAGPGWVFMGGFKLLAGSFLAVFALNHGVALPRAAEPTEMFYTAFNTTIGSSMWALALTGIFVVTCQLKINVTNAYAGSIAWSNFFSRLTHAHPGRVVWLVFNVLLALMLMELGIWRAIESVLMLYANFAVAWIGALTADLVINKPMGWSPSFIEFKRAHLYDINPVGAGSMFLSVILSTIAFVGVLGPVPQALSPFIGLVTAFATAPLIAWGTGGRYYLARQPTSPSDGVLEERCVICENVFERPDMALCPAYNGPICSLCCTLEARCHDVCKTGSRFGEQFAATLAKLLPERLFGTVRGSVGHFLGILFLFAVVISTLLLLVFYQYGARAPDAREAIGTTLWIVFFSLLVVCGIAAWLLVLAQESRRAAVMESQRQTAMLMDEIEAHERTDAALQKAKELAESANEAKSRYIVGISHEIRSPLNAIFGYAQLLERGTARPENAVKVIRRSASHLSNLVDGLLDISKIESGVLRLSRDKVRFGELLEQIVDMFRLQATAKGIAFHYHRPTLLPAFVHADQKRLRQILINLLSNAIKYTAQGQVSFTVRYPSSQVAEFEITDTGFGIRPEDLEEIFKPFERGGMASAHAVPGVGLGLTITRVVVQIMGGEICVRSVPGQGSTFVVRLLLSQAEGESEASGERMRALGYTGPRVNVLLADDDPSHLELVEATLKPLGFNVFMARDGATCLELAAECVPDLILLDIAMPGMNGWETAAALRRMNLPQLRIMMVSANAHDYRSGADGRDPHDAFLIKPVDIDFMLERIGCLLRLTWIFEGPEETEKRSGAPAVQHALTLPASARPYIDELKQLGRIGHVRGVEAKLREMGAAEPEYGAAVARLQALVLSFDLKSYNQLLSEVKFDA